MADTAAAIDGELTPPLQDIVATADDLRAFLAPQFPKFWLPDAYEFIDAIPRTSAGKFKKSELRQRFKGYQLGV